MLIQAEENGKASKSPGLNVSAKETGNDEIMLEKVPLPNVGPYIRPRPDS